jgi:hypothetical protein
MSINVNRWKSTNIYGNLNNYPLYSDASGTTLIQASGFHTDGNLSCNYFKLESASSGDDGILYHSAVLDSTTEYAIYMFSGGDVNFNAKTNLYLKTSDVIACTVNSTGLTIQNDLIVNGNIKIGSSNINTIYQTISGMSSYLTTSSASSTYKTIAGMSSYQTVSGMSSYLTTSSASSTYQPISSMSSYLTTSSASSTYQTIASMSSYVNSTVAVSLSSNLNVGGDLNCNNLAIKQIGLDTSIYNNCVSNYNTDYNLFAFNNGDANLNGATNLYLKIHDVLCGTLTSSELTLANNLVVTGSSTLATVTSTSLNINSTKTVSGIQFGNANPSSSGTYTVVFPSTFANTPIVTTTIVYAGSSWPSVNAFITSTSTTSFQFNVFFTGSTHSENFVSVNWIAIC